MNLIQIIGGVLLGLPLLSILMFVFIHFLVEEIRDFRKDQDPFSAISMVAICMIFIGFILLMIGGFL